VALTAEHDYASQASRQCARTCGALTRVRRARLSKKVFAKTQKKRETSSKAENIPANEMFWRQ